MKKLSLLTKWTLRFAGDGVVEDILIQNELGTPLHPRNLEDKPLLNLDFTLRLVQANFGITHSVEMYRQIVEAEMQRRGIAPLLPPGEE